MIMMDTKQEREAARVWQRRVESQKRHLTFSQAHGYERLPSPLTLEEISKEARTELWDLLADR